MLKGKGVRERKGGGESRSMGNLHTSINSLLQSNGDRISRSKTQKIAVTRKRVRFSRITQ